MNKDGTLAKEPQPARRSMYFASSLWFEQPYEDPPPPAHRRDRPTGRAACIERSGEAADRASAGGTGAVVQLCRGICVQEHVVAPFQGAARGGGDPYAGERHP